MEGNVYDTFTESDPYERPSFTLGIEEEYMVIDPETRELKSHLEFELLSQGKAVLEEKVKPEMHGSMLEIGTSVCNNVSELSEELRKIRSVVKHLTGRNGLKFGAASTHPFSHWATQEIHPDARYQAIVEDMQVLARSLLIFGMHVHIGIENRETQIKIMNEMRYFLPHLLALTVNSPFWTGFETGLKSYRSKVFERFPRTGIPDPFTSWGEYESYVKLLVKTRCIDNAKRIWWDIRPHPSFPTLEIRICDVPMTLDESVGIAALIQAIAAKLFALYRRNLSFRVYSRALITENKWRAVRYGIDGKMIDFGKQKEVATRDLIRELLVFVDDVVDDLGSRDQLNIINDILENGSGAARQLRVFEQSGKDHRAVVDYIVEQTSKGLQVEAGDLLTVQEPSASTLAERETSKFAKGDAIV
ncbi:MAG TPA: carboxylate-amine ligase [Candidatus Kapabacteria bacterium]|jgi:carboxylate-amine ligase|nr:carboxylate-amine ligase [Candidatus Kapabacteria bacterium]